MRPFHFVCWPVSVFVSFALGVFPISSAQAQTSSIKAVFEKHNLLGTFAWDCSQPANKQNYYFVHRLIDANHVQRDMMDGPTARGFVVMIDKAVGSKPNEISVSGTRDDKPFSSIYRVESNRMLVVESTVDGKVVVAGGRVPNGGAVPWANKCAG